MSGVHWPLLASCTQTHFTASISTPFPGLKWQFHRHFNAELVLSQLPGWIANTVSLRWRFSNPMKRCYRFPLDTYTPVILHRSSARQGCGPAPAHVSAQYLHTERLQGWATSSLMSKLSSLPNFPNPPLAHDTQSILSSVLRPNFVMSQMLTTILGPQLLEVRSVTSPQFPSIPRLSFFALAALAQASIAITWQCNHRRYSQPVSHIGIDMDTNFLKDPFAFPRPSPTPTLLLFQRHYFTISQFLVCNAEMAFQPPDPWLYPAPQFPQYYLPSPLPPPSPPSFNYPPPPQPLSTPSNPSLQPSLFFCE